MHHSPVPEVWSPDGPVLDDGVPPLFRVHLKFSLVSTVHPHVFSSKVQSSVPLRGDKMKH